MKEKELVCMGIRYNNQIVSYGWYEIGHLTSPFFSIPLKENEAYMSGARTLNEFRGNNLAAYLRYQMYQHMAKKGIDTLYSITLYSNVPSLRFKQKLNAKILKLYLYVRLTKKMRRVFVIRNFQNKK